MYNWSKNHGEPFSAKMSTSPQKTASGPWTNALLKFWGSCPPPCRIWNGVPGGGYRQAGPCGCNWLSPSPQQTSLYQLSQWQNKLSVTCIWRAPTIPTSSGSTASDESIAHTGTSFCHIISGLVNQSELSWASAGFQTGGGKLKSQRGASL